LPSTSAPLAETWTTVGNVGGGVGWNFSPYVGAMVQTQHDIEQRRRRNWFCFRQGVGSGLGGYGYRRRRVLPDLGWFRLKRERRVVRPG
jgi:hypothetical protein